jgi:hypothetical protein
MGSRYLKVNASALERSDFTRSKKHLFFNDSKTLADTFNKNGVNSENQVLFLSTRSLRDSLTEFVTGAKFEIEKADGDYIDAIIKKRTDSIDSNLHIFLLNAKKSNCSKGEIMDFLLFLNDNGKFRSYLESINEFFMLNMDLDLIFKLSESNMSTLRKRKILYDSYYK